MLCSLLGIDVGRFRDRISMPVASISIVEMAVHGPLLHMMGDRGLSEAAPAQTSGYVSSCPKPTISLRAMRGRHNPSPKEAIG